MVRSLIFLCLMAAFCTAINAHQVDSVWEPLAYGQCHEGLVWTDCSGLCRRTCDDQQPVDCLKRMCRPGCICPENHVMNRFSRCVEVHRCAER